MDGEGPSQLSALRLSRVPPRRKSVSALNESLDNKWDKRELSQLGSAMRSMQSSFFLKKGEVRGGRYVVRCVVCRTTKLPTGHLDPGVSPKMKRR